MTSLVKNLLYKFFKFLNKNTLIVFFSYIGFLALVTIFFCKLYVIKSPHLIDINGNFLINKVSNGFGDIIAKLRLGQIPFLFWVNEIELYAARRLFVPYFLIFSKNIISENFIFIHLFKNIFFAVIIFFTIKNYNQKYNNIFLILSLFLIYYIPFNTFNLLGMQQEEGWLNYLFIILFFTLIGDYKLKSFYFAIIISMIFFLKGSMFFLTFILPVVYLVYEKKDKFKYLPLIFIICSNLIWGSYTYNVAGFFAFGSKGSSMNASNLYMISTKDFNNSYPDVMPDVYLNRVKDIILEKNIKNEKEFMEKLISLSINYMTENPLDYARSLGKKIYTLNINPFKDAQYPENFDSSVEKFDYKIHKTNNPIRFSNIPNKIVFNLSILFFFYILLVRKNNTERIKKINYYYLFILILYLFPYMIAWIYERHATTMYALSHLYFLIMYCEIKKNTIFLK